MARIVDVAVVGGGIVGLTTAREILSRFPTLRLALLEAEECVGSHQSSHNSGVLHAGIYYKPGSDRARLCVRGIERMYSYLKQKGLPFEQCGKLIVARHEKEFADLALLHERAIANGVPDLRIVPEEGIQEIEPFCIGKRALFSPITGITDFGLVCESLADDIRTSGGSVMTNSRVSNIETGSEGTKLTLGNDQSLFTTALVVCAGAESDRLAVMGGASSEPRVVPVRGSWLALKPEHSSMVKGMIYPVPNRALPFLGVHFTRRISTGEIWTGPNSVLALGRRAYRPFQELSTKDAVDTFTYSGTYRLAMQHWKSGLLELFYDTFPAAQLKMLQSYIPSLRAEHFSGRKESGLRAMALQPDGTMVDDFLLHLDEGRGHLHVRNAPSPAATASLAIAEEIVDKMSAVLRKPATRRGPKR